jgi:hypothetical protein
MTGLQLTAEQRRMIHRLSAEGLSLRQVARQVSCYVVSGDVGRHDVGHGQSVPARQIQGVGLASGSLGFGLHVGAPRVPP